MAKFFHSGMTGAPVMSGTIGALIGVLDACLKDGFGAKTITSMVVSGGVATATVGSGHSAMVNTTVLVAGTSAPGLNGDQVVTAISATTVSWATTVADGTYTGTMALRMSPLGFTKPYSGTNKAAYKSGDPAATGCLLRVDDTVATTSRVVGYETMSDVDTGVNPFPTAAQFSGGMYWAKSNAADSTARSWLLIGDSKAFYLYVAAGAAENLWGFTFFFGDFISNKAADAWCCKLTGGAFGVTTAVSDNGDVGGMLTLSSNPAVSNTNSFIARAYSSVAGAIMTARTTAYISNSAQSGNTNSGTFPFPDPTNNGLLLSPIDVRDTGVMRGRMPGVYASPQYISTAMTHRTVIDGAGVFAGKKMLVVRAGSNSGNANAGTIFFDLLGAWR